MEKTRAEDAAIDDETGKNDDHQSHRVSSSGSLSSKIDVVMKTVIGLGRKTKNLAKDDPRRVTHSLKAGLAITVVSLFYYFDPLYDGFGASAMWAVLTVIVVFEFSVGATLGRGLNRVLATFFAGALGFGAHFLATLSGEKAKPIMLGAFVFLLAATATFVRFFPRIKARYDYGFLIFILTFCLVSMSGYRDDEILKVAYQRALTILIGTLIAIIICLFISPVWAGDDLHSLISNNIEILGTYLQGFGIEYTNESIDREFKGADLQGFKRVLASRQTEETLVNFARWEPGHEKIKFGHPWKQYRKIGSLTRQCAYRLESLNSYLVTEIQAPLEIRDQLKESCLKMGIDSGRALKEIAISLRTMTRTDEANNISPHSQIEKSKNVAKNLKSILKIGNFEGSIDLLQIVPAVTVASLLIDSISCIEKIEESVRELASLARFKSLKQPPPPLPPLPATAAMKSTSEHQHQQQLQPKLSTPAIVSGHFHVVTIE